MYFAKSDPLQYLNKWHFIANAFNQVNDILSSFDFRKSSANIFDVLHNFIR